MRALLLSNHRLSAQHAAFQKAAELAAWIICTGPADGGEPCPCLYCGLASPQQRAVFEQIMAQEAHRDLGVPAQSAAGLPPDALMEVVRCLAAEPISSWMR